MKKKIIYLTTFISVIAIFFSFNSHNSFINDLIQLVEVKRNSLLKESVFLHTDRASYQPGDTLWVKGYVNDYTFGLPSKISQTLHVNLVDKNKDTQTSSQFYINSGKIEGAILIPHTLNDGEFNLVAYTSTMKNYNKEWYFVKPIYIKSLKVLSQIIPNLNFNINYDKVIYSSGDNVVAKLSFIKDKNDHINKTTFEYTVYTPDSVIKQFKSEAINFGDVYIRFNIPENKEKIAIDVKVVNRDQSLSYTSIVPQKSNNIVISFFPEGGSMIYNLGNKVAFQATDSSGNPLKINGDLVDENGSIVAKIATTFNGLGRFNFVPITKKSYFVAVNDQLIPLNNILEDGLLLKVNKIAKDTLDIRVSSTNRKKQKIHVSATMRDKIYWGADGILNKTALLRIPLTKMPKGILQITVFDKNKTPQAERLYFVNQEKKLNIEITTNERVYDRRDSMLVKIKVTDHLNNGIKTELSFAAIDALFNENNLNRYYTNLDDYFTLSSQLHGDWKKALHKLPIWNDEKLTEAIDLMLMTFGWRKFEWDNLYNEDALINYELIKGRVTKGKNKPYQNIPFNLFSFNSNQILSSTSDSSGLFYFNKLDLLPHATSMFISPSLTDYSTNVRFTLNDDDIDNPEFISVSSNSIQYQSKLYTPTTQLEVNNFAHYKLLQEVIIKERKLIEYSDPILKQFTNASSKRGEDLTHSYDILGLIRQVKPISYHDVTNNKIYFRPRIGGNSIGALFVLDGFVSGNDYSMLPSNISADNVEYITVVTGLSGSSLYGSNARDGVVFITTKSTPDTSEPKTAKNLIFLKGYSKHRVFYSPKYNTEEKKSFPFPDLRKTIYWNPTISTNEDGEATVSFYNADRKTIVNINVQGMSSTGLFGSANTSYTVLPTN